MCLTDWVWWNPSIFLSKQGCVQVHVCIYVDDIIIASSNEEEITWLLHLMVLEFPIRDLGDLNFFLGIQVDRIEDGLHLTQTQYLVNLLRSCDMENLKPVVTPMVAYLDLHLQSELILEPKEYRCIIGSLQYITLTCPDVQLANNRLSLFMANPAQVHWTTMKRVLRFLSGTPNHGIILCCMTGCGIMAYCDTDWGGDTIDRKSETGFLVYVGGSLVSWITWEQGIVVRSSAEAEYRVIVTTTQEVEVMRTMLQELRVYVPFPLKIFADNLRALFIAWNTIADIRLKHVTLDLHFVRERTEKGELVFEHIPRTQQWADILIKLTPRRRFSHCRQTSSEKFLELEEGAC